MRDKLIRFVIDKVNPTNKCDSCGFTARESKFRMCTDSFEMFCPKCDSEINVKGNHPDVFQVMMELSKYMCIDDEIGRMMFDAR